MVEFTWGKIISFVLLVFGIFLLMSIFPPVVMDIIRGPVASNVDAVNDLFNEVSEKSVVMQDLEAEEVELKRLFDLVVKQYIKIAESDQKNCYSFIPAYAPASAEESGKNYVLVFSDLGGKLLAYTYEGVYEDGCFPENPLIVQTTLDYDYCYSKSEICVSLSRNSDFVRHINSAKDWKNEILFNLWTIKDKSVRKYYDAVKVNLESADAGFYVFKDSSGKICFVDGPKGDECDFGEEVPVYKDAENLNSKEKVLHQLLKEMVAKYELIAKSGKTECWSSVKLNSELNLDDDYNLAYINDNGKVSVVMVRGDFEEGLNDPSMIRAREDLDYEFCSNSILSERVVFEERNFFGRIVDLINLGKVGPDMKDFYFWVDEKGKVCIANSNIQEGNVNCNSGKAVENLVTEECINIKSCEDYSSDKCIFNDCNVAPGECKMFSGKNCRSCEKVQRGGCVAYTNYNDCVNDVCGLKNCKWNSNLNMCYSV